MIAGLIVNKDTLSWLQLNVMSKHHCVIARKMFMRSIPTDSEESVCSSYRETTGYDNWDSTLTLRLCLYVEVRLWERFTFHIREL
jgi:hypothetical protein